MLLPPSRLTRLGALTNTRDLGPVKSEYRRAATVHLHSFELAAQDAATSPAPSRCLASASLRAPGRWWTWRILPVAVVKGGRRSTRGKPSARHRRAVTRPA